VIVPAWATDRVPPDALLDALRAAYDRGARLMSFCSGAFALAHAGLLDGRRATTHWMYAEKLAAQFPLVDVDAAVLYVDAGRILTSAGTAAGIDLCLHLVRLDHGAEVANAVARRMVVPPHRDGGQAQFVEAPMAAQIDGDDPFTATLDWAVEHLDQPLSVELLAQRAAMSPRTFARRFRASSGATPHQWLLKQRVVLAMRLLETTDQPVERIASRCGFGSAAVLRTHFQRHVGTSPAGYRRTFCGDRASVEAAS
jgi:transcriptional regulator GlxA family with amidase domain